MIYLLICRKLWIKESERKWTDNPRRIMHIEDIITIIEITLLFIMNLAI
jgi:hypothetical protein